MTVAVIYISADSFISPRMRTPKSARHREILRENKPFALRWPWPRRPKQAVLCPLGGGFVPDSINHGMGRIRLRAEVLAVFSPERRLLSREAYKSWFFAFTPAAIRPSGGLSSASRARRGGARVRTTSRHR